MLRNNRTRSMLRKSDRRHTREPVTCDTLRLLLGHNQVCANELSRLGRGRIQYNQLPAHHLLKEKVYAWAVQSTHRDAVCAEGGPFRFAVFRASCVAA